MKGITRIQLFEEDKEVLNQIDENFFTNCPYNDYTNYIEDMFRWLLIDTNTQASSYTTFPSFKDLIAGILLFDNTQSTDINNSIYNGSLVGCVDTSITNIKKLYGIQLLTEQTGNKNDTESGVISGGYRLVYDFPTDKANGTINCVSLAGGIRGMVNSSGKVNLDKFIVANSIKGKPIIKFDSLDYELLATLPTGYTYYEKKNYIVGIPDGYNNRFNIFLLNGTKLFTSDKILPRNIRDMYNNTSGFEYVDEISNKYLYYTPFPLTGKTYKFNVDTDIDNEVIINSESMSQIMSCNGLLVFRSNSNAKWYKQDGSLSIYTSDNRLYNRAGNVNSASYPLTINNLASPVTKSSSQTMKITYDIMFT